MDKSDSLKMLTKLRSQLDGDLFTDYTTRILYATDASNYREIPLAVVRAKNTDDIKKLVRFANRHKTSLILRTAGTSLAGQVVGNGIVVDVSKYMTRVLEVNTQERWVRVEPGVILDELNKMLEPMGLFFGPETSTSNRCMIGGMLGNNSCGAHSLIYGSTRDHTVSVKTILSDGSEVEFGKLTNEEFNQKQTGDKLENKIYRKISEILSNPENQKSIRKEYPDKKIKRRNTGGYAVDLLLETAPFSKKGEKFNFSKLLAGSEGTLAISTEITLNLIPLPPKEKALVCVHCASLNDALKGNLVALKHNPGAIELIDEVIIRQTKYNIEQQKNRFFIQGEPKAILLIEFARNTKEEILEIAANLEKDMRSSGFGYYFPVVFDEDIQKIWALRKAGLGLLTSIPGDAKPVSVVEDTAVNPKVLPEYIGEFRKMLDSFGLNCVYYAHIATGELHLRPVLNLKKKEDVELFHQVALATAKLVKKYHGSLSGEHGDGRLRGEFISLMIGEHNYNLLREIKKTWDPDNIFNPGKITDTPPMNSFLRYKPGSKTREIDTIFDFSTDHGFMRAVEKCNGSGDCRKSEIIGGTMCPSYMATKDEQTSTRARANTLREILTNSPKSNPFDHNEIYNVMDLCLSCKGCKSECPSSIDMAKYKAEFLQHYYDSNGIPLRTRAIAYITSLNRIGAIFPRLTNFFFKNNFTSFLLKKMLGFAPKRTIPLLSKIRLRKWAKKNLSEINPKGKKIGTVIFFIDEFTDYNDAEIGIKALKLLTGLGYQVQITSHKESGRTFLSKGLLRKAKKIANFNVSVLKDFVTENSPLIGIEPSGILSFRDEYPDLVDNDLKDAAKKLSENSFMIDEFLEREIKKGNIPKERFIIKKRKILLHGHCHQKSLASTSPTKTVLSFPENYEVEEIKSGCCGMAGSFGYEKEHYEISMKIGELVLFPAIRDAGDETIIAAPGTSCRQQIKDGTGRRAYHPVEILYDALIK